MSRIKSLLLTLVLALVLISLLAGCAPATTTQVPTSTATATATTTTDGKPQGNLVAALQGFGSENFLTWLDPKFSTPQLMVYDMLIYWDHINHVLLPGVAESWEVSADGLTTTYHIRKGIQFSDGWGELTATDVKYSIEMQGSPESIGKTAQARRIASMDIPDPYTLVVHMKTPYPTFYLDFSMANSGVCQGMMCKAYIDKVGEEVAGQKPIGSGPYRLVDSQLGDFYKFEALDSHWRVVPEFKTVTVRLLTESSSVVAALKNHEIDLSEVPNGQLEDLKTAGLGTEVNPVGGSILMVSLGGMIIPEDKRYDAAKDNKDPWADTRVRKAMAIAIDRAAIAKAVYAGLAKPASVPLLTLDYDKYQYPYDPAAAKQLLKDADYPNGFSFRCVSSVNPNDAQAPRVMEALAGYWEQIGLKPQIATMDYNAYYAQYVVPCKTAGDVTLTPINSVADQLAKAELFLFPNVQQVVFQDEGSYAIYKALSPNATYEQRLAVVEQLNQYYYDNVGPIPVVRTARTFAWNPATVGPWPHVEAAQPLYLEYVRHAKPLNNYRLFIPWPGR